MTNLGKIESIRLGLGGYQDAQFGLTIVLGGPGWGVQTFLGWWADEPSEFAKWTLSDQRSKWADVCAEIIKHLRAAKKESLHQLVGVPIEAKFDDGITLTSWRILTEVI